MVCRADKHAVRRQIIDLKQESRYNPFYLASLMDVATFLANSIKLIEEKHTRLRSHEVE
tara:strand:+ start:107319 stop:107495 length:177 start_codon:yes stop_codon:yes gene_type:complete